MSPQEGKERGLWILSANNIIIFPLKFLNLFFMIIIEPYDWIPKRINYTFYGGMHFIINIKSSL